MPLLAMLALVEVAGLLAMLALVKVGGLLGMLALVEVAGLLAMEEVLVLKVVALLDSCFTVFRIGR